MVRTTHLELDVLPPFDFRAAATPHGRVILPCTAWLSERQLVLEGLREASIAAEALQRKLRSLKGVGP
jgi:hypothetical protein